MLPTFVDPWIAIVEAELQLAMFDGYAPPLPPISINSRNYLCEYAGCLRPAYAKKLCNMHYIRSSRGTDMDAPAKSRGAKVSCRKCGRSATHGGWFLCAQHYKEIRRAVIKNVLVRLLGGKCQRCKKKYPSAVFDFHHVGSKLHSVGNLLGSAARLKDIVAEVRKCVLFCANCHRIEHNASDI